MLRPTLPVSARSPQVLSGAAKDEPRAAVKDACSEGEQVHQVSVAVAIHIQLLDNLRPHQPLDGLPDELVDVEGDISQIDVTVAVRVELSRQQSE